MSRSEASSEKETAAGGAEPPFVTTIKNLRCAAASLKGVAARAATGERPNYLPIRVAGCEIVRAACKGLLTHILDLRAIAPEVRLLMDAAQASESGEPDFARWPEMVSSRIVIYDHTTNGPVSPNPPNTTTLWPQYTQDEMNQMLDDPAGYAAGRDVPTVMSNRALAHWSNYGLVGASPLDDPGWLMANVVIRCWRHLVKTHRDALSPDAAYAYTVTPRTPWIWVGSNEDFNMAAWACEFLANQIEERWDVITISEAAKQYRIVGGVISRACKATNTRAALIKSTGAGKQLRMSRKSFLEWHRGYVADKAKREERKRVRVRPRLSYECRGCDWTSEEAMDHPSGTCPKCGHATVRPLTAPRGGATRRNKPRN